ncbi:BACON domain-containing protein [Bacteroides oleiciplenus]|uniref:BACON domain-containing protein n=1 Tax=Bacteroides oleiciplenus TaxID=626931 RepID=UPI0026DD909B|nr:BACON domain-containing protein [Bacteroides oleiciplenus]
MKSKLYYLLWLFAIMPLAFFSCDDDNEMEEATLEVSMDPVNFAKAGGEQTVTITTNMDKWVATSPLESSWLTLTQSGNQLSVKANINTEGVERKGYILVNAGSAAAKISVMQSAGDVILNISAEKVAFAKKGGEQRIDVVSNDDFKVEVDQAANTWLTTTFMEGTNYFTISAGMNSGADERTGKIYITAGSTTKEVTVSQNGEELILLPFFAKEPTIGKIAAYEQERGSVLIKTPDGLFNADQYHFATANEEFPLIIYACADAYSNYSQAATATTNGDLCKGDKFEKYMTTQGFEKKGEGQYNHKEFPYSVAITFEDGGATILATYAPKQSQDYPTFSEIPLKQQMEWTGLFEEEIHGAKYAVVEDWEAKKGATLNTESSNLPAFAWFDPAKSDANTVARAYWINTEEDKAPAEYISEINGARVLYDKIDLVMWQDGNTYRMTKEFEKLLADAGFIYLSTSSNGYLNYVKGNNALVFKVVQFSDFMVGTRLVDFQTFKLEGGTSAVSILTNMDKRIEFFKQMEKKMQKLEKIQPLKHIK